MTITARIQVAVVLVLALALIAAADTGSSLRGAATGTTTGDNTYSGNNTFSGSNVVSGRLTFGTAANAANAIEFNLTTGCASYEGATADAFETTVCVSDPTADVTFNWPAFTAGTYIPVTESAALTSGRIPFATTQGVLTDDSDMTFATDTLTITKIAGTTLTGTNVATGRTTFGSAADAANAVDLGETAGRVTFEGSTADANETRFGATDPTVGDQVILLPDLAAATTDTIATLAATQTFTNKTMGATVFSGNLTASATGKALGTTAAPFSNIVVHLSGTFGTGSYTFAGTPTANRTITMPADASFTIARQDAAQTFTGVQTFNSGPIIAGDTFLAFGASGATRNSIGFDTTFTPDGTALFTGSVNNAWIITQTSNFGFDYNNGNCGTSACTDPSVWIYSHNQNTAQWGGFWHDGTNFNIKTGTGSIVFNNAVAVTNQLSSTGTAPTVSNTSANSCGTTSAVLTGTDLTGKITVGATSGSSCTITFVTAAPTRRQCWASDETTAVLTRFIYLTTTTGKIDGVFTAGDVLEYGCLTY